MFNKVYLVGVGLINGCLAIDLKKNQLTKSIVGVGRDEKRLAKAKSLNIIDENQTLQNCDVSDADLIVVGVPVGKFAEVFMAIKKTLNQNTIVTDVGSTKQSIIDVAKQNLGNSISNFVPAHPIAGSEKSGFENAIEGIFNSRKVILTPLDFTNSDATKTVKDMWLKLGAHVDELPPKLHDSILAATSHLPHMVAYSLVHCLGKRSDKKEVFNYAAGGFYDFTRIASSDPAMWSDICVQNKDNIIEGIDAFISNLTTMKNLISKQDADALYELFEQAKDLRDANKIS